jgi:hypothetical protein
MPIKLVTGKERTFRPVDPRKVAFGEVQKKPAVGLTNLGAKAHCIAESREGKLIQDEAIIRSLLGIKAS